MAVVTVKSTAITNRDATPRVHNSDYLEGGVNRMSIAAVAVTTGDTSTSKYILAKIPSSARLSAISLFSDDMGSQTTLDFGLWDTTDNGSAVVSATLFASAYDVHSGAVNGTNILFSNLAISNAEKRVWELLALAADPGKDYDLVARVATTSDAGGNLTVHVSYVI